MVSVDVKHLIKEEKLALSSLEDLVYVTNRKYQTQQAFLMQESSRAV